MKILNIVCLSSTCLLALLIQALGQPASAPPPNRPAAKDQNSGVTAAQLDEGSAATPTDDSASKPTAPDTAAPTEPRRRASPAAGNSQELRLNFRNAPLETVLNYLSEAAGYIIELQTEVKGKVNVWSNQPVTKEEALDLLNAALDKNGYAAVRRGRTLTIWSKEDAKKRDLPVRSGNKPDEIPKNDEMVTQIIPVRYISAVQVSRDLQPLLPEKATMTANEGGNSLIITDTQTSIRRMAEILRALDTAISSVSSVKVFPLIYADAKALASVIKDLFAPQETNRGSTGNNAGGNRFVNQFRGGGPGGFGPGGAFGGGGGANSGSSSSDGRAPTPRVVAVAEERSNSVVVSAPDEQMPIIEDLIRQVDTNVVDVTELRVFRLRFADAQETADLLSNLFSDTGSSSNSQNNRGQIQFGGRFGGPFGAGRGTSSSSSGDASSRLQKQNKVVAVPDLRTGSVVVSAARDLMVQIGEMIKELDSDAAKKQQVYVFDVQNTDAQSVQDILQSLFPAPQTGNSSSSRLNSRNQNGAGSQLNNRATQNQNQGSSRSSSGFGSSSSGFGSSGGFGTGR